MPLTTISILTSSIFFVIELKHIELATEADKQYGIDTWARLFKAKTWEEIKMITKDNPSMNSTAENTELKDENAELKAEVERLNLY